MGLLLGPGFGMLVLRWRSIKVIELTLPAREEVERSAGLGAEIPIMRFEGRAKVLTKSIQPIPSVASEDTMALLSDNIRKRVWHCEEKVWAIVLQEDKFRILGNLDRHVFSRIKRFRQPRVIAMRTPGDSICIITRWDATSHRIV